MPVLFDSSATKLAVIAGSATSGTASGSHNVSGTATNLYAIVALYFSGTVSVASGVTFAATFGGEPMTAVSNGQALWGSSEGTVILYYLANPPTGANTVQVSVAGLATQSGSRYLGFASATYSGVASVGSGTTQSGSSAFVEVTSATAPLFVNALGCTVAAGGESFTGYNQTSRVNTASVTNVNQPLLIGDAAGSGLVDFSATAPANSEEWAALAVGLLGNSVSFDAAGAGATGLNSSATWSHTVNASATALLVAVNAYNTSASAIAAVAGSTNMELLGSVTYGLYSSNPFLSPFGALYLFGLMHPPTGAVTMKVTSSPASYITANSVSYTGALAFDTLAANDGANNQIDVPSNLPAWRVVTAHGVSPTTNTFTYNQTKRAVASLSSADQVLLLGDAPGASYVTAAAGMSAASQYWGAAGVSLAPAPVVIEAATLLGPFLTAAGLADYRAQTPSPMRIWEIPGLNGET